MRERSSDAQIAGTLACTSAPSRGWTPHDVEARTIDISASGCFVVASQPILVGQRVRLTNLVKW
jgi:hypothetical protein